MRKEINTTQSPVLKLIPNRCQEGQHDLYAPDDLMDLIRELSRTTMEASNIEELFAMNRFAEGFKRIADKLHQCKICHRKV